MKIIHISDTHGCHHRLKYLPEADVIVHSGDFCMVGTQQEALDFLNWFCDLPYKYKIFICGNHDECLYKANIEGLDSNVFYLNNSDVEIEGVKFYGVPLFMSDALGRQNLYYKAIPSDIDVLVTHAPAVGILDFDMDRNWGSEILLNRINEIHPKAHLFGHIHLGHGLLKRYGTIYSNGAIMNDNYTNINSYNLIEI